jgi:hypothetical protein
MARTSAPRNGLDIAPGSPRELGVAIAVGWGGASRLLIAAQGMAALPGAIGHTSGALGERAARPEVGRATFPA